MQRNKTKDNTSENKTPANIVTSSLVAFTFIFVVNILVSIFCAQGA